MKNSRFNDYKLGDEIITSLQALAYHTPTDVQRKVIPLVLEQTDLIVKSQTGSGKTAAYAIPIAESIDWLENKPQALILTPTRELAVQVKEDFTNIGRFKRIKALAVFGKQSFASQKVQLKQKTHVVVGTPGRVFDHIGKGTLSLDQIRYLVIDEADEMLNMGFIEQVEAIIKALPKDRVTMLFSATLPKEIKELSHRYMVEPVDIEIETGAITADEIDHVLIEVSDDQKYDLLRDLTIVENPDSCIIFCRTKGRVDRLTDQLIKAGYPCGKIHGDMAQEARLAVMRDFKHGRFRYLVATDLAARGIDIDKLSHIINYDLPLKKEGYVHRTGRTGRAGEVGKAITFMLPSEEKFLPEIEAYLGFEIKRSAAPKKAEVAKNRPAFDRKINLKSTIKKEKNENLNKDIMKLYFNGGKRKKLRAVDFVGTIAKIKGVTAEDIGIITILDRATFIEILNGKGPLVLKTMKNTTVKGKLLKVYEAKE
ncbi:DEAD/DEAH box helicase [Amphibacillus sp. MSJ-3]|uniref:DEAD/DEAH box helicase n=1 Tax=Amphibacillus sp. MSJ-3 TaxID=2841505 RepID=UPI001C0EAB4E|nr:DEAD/DEAH box helicase [Amphibacillus sp. MSJ-3]MBU5594315.1 DEAD/DEAH box helicase [Amphibacillus sp. MSJ-3]